VVSRERACDAFFAAAQGAENWNRDAAAQDPSPGAAGGCEGLIRPAEVALVLIGAGCRQGPGAGLSGGLGDASQRRGGRVGRRRRCG
jgi:hypothetical protein